jgi:hypothetical protein
MPPARRSARSSSRRSAFKEPAALKQLNKSLASAQKALTDLRKQAGRDAAKSTQSLHGDLRKFLANARRDSGKFTAALRRDFEQAQKALAQSSRSQTRRSTARKSTATARKSTATARKSTASARRSTAGSGARRTTRKTS